MLPLMLINLSTESNIHLGLLHAQLGLLHPDLVVAIHVFVEFLQSREHGTRQRADNKGGLVTDDGIPALLPINCGVKVVSAFDVHGISRRQAESAAYSCYPLGAEHLTHVGAGKLRVEALHGAAVHSKLYPPVRVDLIQEVADDGFAQDELVLGLHGLRSHIIDQHVGSRAASCPGEQNANLRGGDRSVLIVAAVFSREQNANSRVVKLMKKMRQLWGGSIHGLWHLTSRRIDLWEGGLGLLAQRHSVSMHQTQAKYMTHIPFILK